MGARQKEVMHQIDTYFKISEGRLKLRELSKNNAYLIYYKRGEKTTERYCRYYTYDVLKQKEFKDFFGITLGIKTIVDKKRILFRYKNARIHVDTVKGLGNFIEIEVEVKKGDTQAQNLMKELLEYLKIPKSDFIKESYSDLILRKRR